MRVLVFCFILISVVFSQTSQCNINSEKTLPGKLLADVECIIKQKDVKYDTTVSSELYVVANSEYTFFHSLKNDLDKYRKYMGENNISFDFAQVKINKALTDGFITLKIANQNKVKWHTINIEKNKDNKWEIIAWHISV